MDEDLAFCLGSFIDGQVEIIDNRLDKLREEEAVECRRLEQEKNAANKKKPPPKNKGSHYDDKALIDQLIADLQRDEDRVNQKKEVIDDPISIANLNAEVSTKVSACITYINRIRNLAQTNTKTAKFIESCNEATTYFRQKNEYENNFQTLCTILEDSNADNVVQNVQRWWKEKYGNIIADLNRRNQKINPAVAENGFTTVSPTSRVLDNAKKVVASKKPSIPESQKAEIIRKFVNRLLTIDEENRDNINPEELIDQLNGSTIEQIMDYTKKWIAKRDAIRNQKEPEDPFDIQINKVKAELGRKRIAQEAKKLALAALLCRLAVGSSNTLQFDQQLKKTINKQKQSSDKNIPIISGDIKDPKDQELCVQLQLDSDKTDLKQWANNSNGFQQKFGTALCQAFLLPNNAIRIGDIQFDKAIINLLVQPPYGGNVVDSLNGTAPDAVDRMQAVRRCVEEFHTNIASITLGEFGLKIEDKLMDPRWNKRYTWPNSNPDQGQYWAKPIDQGGKPYYCPSGWQRFGVKVAEDEKEFDAHWGTWHVAYHGTQDENASKILTSGLRVSTSGCFYGDGVPRVYVSPSIEYCAHPRYARPWKRANKNGQTRWYQLVFQCRVNPASIHKIGPETLIKNEYKAKVKVDQNFDNGELEWVILGKEDQMFITDDIICYGMMMRVSNVDPVTLTPSIWWKSSHHYDIYKK